MSVPILAAKLYITVPRTGIVMRHHLTDRINDGLAKGGKLTLVSAPAGFGKTTLISEWITQLARPVAWLSLDEGDSDLTRFLSYLIAALQTIKPGLGENILASLPSLQPHQTETIFTNLLNEISTIAQKFVLVLDDYHVIDSRPIDDVLAYIVERQPQQMHLVLATREDPHISLARLRSRGQLIELRAVDLRFTPAETAEFLNRTMGLNLSIEHIAALETRTEGWIAGLQLAALSMEGLQDSASFIRSFTGSHRFILDYLIEEVLGRLPENIQGFLLRTSILDRMCGSLCDAVLDAPSGSGQETLEYLERANLFIVPLDQERRWYRYHHLFGDLLRQRLGLPQELHTYHLRASEWYEANDDLSKAFKHAIAANELERAARLAEAAWKAMERYFQTAAWLGWVKKLPDAVILSHPRLCLQLGSAFSDAGDPDTSEIHLQNAERALTRVTDLNESNSIAGNIALIRASNAQNQGNLTETVKFAELSLAFIREDDLYLRAQAAITLELTHWAAGDMEASIDAMHDWTDNMQRLGNQVFVIASAFAVADMQVVMGRLGEAERTLRQAIQQAAALGREAELVTAHHHLGLAMLAHERFDEASTKQHLQTAAELGKHTTLVDWSYRWNMALARLKESAGDWDAALRLIDEARRCYVKTAVPMVQPIEAHQARVYLKQGRLDKAQTWARGRSLSTQDDVSYFDEYEHLTLIRILLAEGSFTGINDLLERVLGLAETQKRIGSLIEIRLIQARFYQEQSKQSQAFAALQCALTLAEPESYVSIFVDEGEPMRLLISDFKLRIEKQDRNGAYPLFEYINRLLAAFPESRKAIYQSKIENPKSQIIEPLSEREMEVLRLLRSELSGPEIAQRLIVSLNTLRTHTKNIFNKLGVNNRRAAVHRAEELDLF